MMKACFPLLLTAAFALTACGSEPPPAAPASAASASAPASTPAEHQHASEVSAPAAASAPAMAAENCQLTVGTGDSMQYDTKEILISKACTEFTITLKHNGQMPKAAMGHNVVITKEGDMNGVNSDGAGAGIDNGYLKVDDTRIIAATVLIGGGQEASVTFPVSKLSAAENYKFFCSFPGHAGVMNGVVKLVD